ncbi:conserved Plasmodium protein, unknown function [Plasmodium knowlesi strain H]|uniref:RNA polymerase sigma-70 region 3 domain-containing protein n=3 Tax=Plasmodium knowlesi TaxID=5850 RepID=A0A5K1V4L1_PLAKH|nr:conserved Plasmodium protein, unknown function [Plasmodium knowlesi strain H]OTN64678.1 Uncharacterized protein PKNOH_S130195700 [Plasmodium knowlesi]CAA9989119.1 conserved Plasmodium protein, unknown function [Plasmodium knowlesi strain H]SBO27335.1 conserved Plasmodium protein, unknown function [Plasmodium knowlesi strain H]SBO28958.1 conserved Plasmodium protein, unknown function [Plasmodium knowlesi strain H]VVS78593.1 conserved Plasmodium protein, unknown function [Plasmodium knowlesi |eukprot:XP_002261466.1 hypothetical protein, conserved in Plasmodium species [Plasmodium knowlesi strain H]
MQPLLLLLIALIIGKCKTGRGIKRRGDNYHHRCGRGSRHCSCNRFRSTFLHLYVLVLSLILLSENATTIQAYRVTCHGNQLSFLPNVVSKVQRRYSPRRYAKGGSGTIGNGGSARGESAMLPSEEHLPTNRSTSNNYFKSLCSSSVLNKSVDENVNFEDGVASFFTLNPNPNIGFLVGRPKRRSATDVVQNDVEEESDAEEGADVKERADETKETNQPATPHQKKRTKKIRLKLKRGYMNEVYDREKKRLNEVLLSFEDKSIFKASKKKIKENILLLNGQTVNIEVIKQYLFHKLRLEYYESIRDQKKILTLDLWSKEINVSVENLKKLIVYIYKMKTLVQKEDEELLIKTYFYNKTNMFSLFRNGAAGGGDVVAPFDFSVPDVDSTVDDQGKGSDLDPKTKKEEAATKGVPSNGAMGKGGQLLPMPISPKRDIFTDYFDNNEVVLYNDCENLINSEVQKFIECIKDIVFFENSIYMLEKLENRPPLLEEVAFAYNYDKDIFIQKLEVKIKLSQKLLIYFIPLINNIIRKAESNFSSNLSEDDFLLVSLDAVKNGFRRYDVEKLGIKNLTKYVYIWAKNSTYNYYQKHKSFVSVSPHTYKDYNKIKKFEESFEEKHERKPSIKEIADGLSMTMERVQKALSSAVNVIDAEKPIMYQNNNSDHPEKNTYTDLIVNADDIHSMNEIVYNDLVIKGLRKFICKSLKKKINKLIIFMKFGLFLRKKIFTDDEICHTLQITKNKLQKHFQLSLNEIKKYINKIKKNKSEVDPNFDFSSYINFSQYDFLGNDFSQILI